MATLYHYPLDPFSRRIRLALAEHDLQVELAEEQPWALRRPFMDISPSGVLPVFVEDYGATVTVVEAIGEYLEETRPE